MRFWMSPSFGLLLAALLAGAGCSSDDPQTPERRTSDGLSADAGGGDLPPANGKLRFLRQETLDGEDAGQYAAIARNGDTLGIAYLRIIDEAQPQSCPPSNETQLMPVQEVHYVRFDGTDWSAPIKVATSVGRPTFGVSLAYDRSGKPYVGYLGGALSVRECASSDAVYASSSDGGTTWQETLINGGVAPGDTAGQWTSLAMDPTTGQIESVYRDVQFGLYTRDGNARADLRYGPSGEAVSGGIGDGVYAKLVFGADGTPVVASFNPVQTGIDGGIKVFYKGTDWTAVQVAGATQAYLGLATDNQGTFALAYYKPSDQSLYYRETKDLDNWPQEKLVDLSTTNHGTFASLAFDANGNPGVSYYRCGMAGSDCKATDDALMFAYRLKGSWKSYEIDDGGAYDCGRYTSLTFDAANNPVIAYQCVVLDNIKKRPAETLKVAHGSWQ